MRFLILIFSLLISTKVFASDLLEESNPVGRRIKIDLASIDLKTDLNIVDLNFFEGLNLSARYSYEVEPSYQGGYYTRIDRYQIKAEIRPGDFFDYEDLPVYLNIERGSEVIFVRQFQSQGLAVISPPVFNPRRIPFSSKLAIEHMQPGDFVAIPARMNIVVGVGSNWEMIPGIKATVGASHALVSGTFQIHAFRMADDKIRLRLISNHGRGFSFSGGIRSTYDVFGLNIVDRIARRVIHADLPRLTFNRNWGQMVLLDYVYDLKRPEVREAYDRVMKSTFRFRFRDLALMDDLRDKLVSDLLPTEEIRIADLELPPEEQRIQRLFSADNQYKNNNTRIRIGTSFIKFEAGRGRAENRVTYFDRFDRPKVYNYMNSLTTLEGGLVWNLFKYERTKMFSALVSYPTEGAVRSELENIHLSYDLRDKYVSERQRDRLFEKLHRYTNGPVFSDEIFEPWMDAEKLRDARYIVDLWINRDGLTTFDGMEAIEIEKRLRRFIDEMNPPEIVLAQSKGAHAKKEVSYVSFYFNQIKRVAKALAIVFDPTVDGLERGRSYLKLKSNRVFEDYGSAFLISMLEPATLDQDILVRLRADATGTDPIRAHFGTADNLELLNSLQYMQYVLGNGYFDPRWDPIPSRNPARVEP